MIACKAFVLHGACLWLGDARSLSTKRGKHGVRPSPRNGSSTRCARRGRLTAWWDGPIASCAALPAGKARLDFDQWQKGAQFHDLASICLGRLRLLPLAVASRPWRRPRRSRAVARHGGASDPAPPRLRACRPTAAPSALPAMPSAGRCARCSRAVRANREVKVLAIGSSSTAGVGASSPAATYVAKLETIAGGHPQGARLRGDRARPVAARRRRAPPTA